MSIGTSSTPIFLWYSVDSFRLLSGFTNSSFTPGEGEVGGYCHIWAIWVWAAVTGMVFKQFTLGSGI